MRVCILQSNYIPWKGYFDLIAASDMCIIYDSRQYTKNDWRNRNRIIIGGGAQWLSVPVRMRGRFGQRIADTEVADTRWSIKHWKTIEQAYAKRPYFPLFRDGWRQAWREAGALPKLTEVNLLLLSQILENFRIDTPVIRDDAIPGLAPTLEDTLASQSERVARICAHVGADDYLTGPSALGYLRADDFQSRGISITVADYSGYEAYPQAGDDMVHEVSAIDLLVNAGSDAPACLIGSGW